MVIFNSFLYVYQRVLGLQFLFSWDADQAWTVHHSGLICKFLDVF